MASSSTQHVLSSFPDEVPTSPIAISSDLEDSDFILSENDTDDPIQSNSEETTEMMSIYSVLSHQTRSTSSALSLPTTPHITSLWQDDQRTDAELRTELRQLRTQVLALNKEVLSQQAQLHAANAHCTVAQREASDAWLKLENMKRKVT